MAVLKIPMNFQHLQTFCTVLIEKSMTAASQKLFLTQPAVSQQIKHLEEEMGVELLVRGVRQVKATPEGQLLFDYSQRIMNLVSQARVAIQTVGMEVSGPLRVGTLNSIGLHLIGPVFAMFLKNNSSVRLHLHYGEGVEVLQMLTRGEIDIAIIPEVKSEYGTEPESVESEFVLNDEMWLVSAPRADVPKEIALTELAQKPFLLLTKEYPAFEGMLLKEAKKAGATLKPVFESSNVGTLKRAVETGLGWSFLPAHSIRKQVQTGRLQRIHVRGLEYPTQLYCYTTKNQKLPKSVEVFLQALKQLS
ncbi:MAG: LysR family transcriptional regulator [Bdellovibrionales bacterium]|nr:LysR family transcriptional regulator [Bdellovibrionales bacterium]